MTKLYKDKNWLYEKYWGEKISTSAIAKLCNVNAGAIRYMLIKFNIKRRTGSEGSKLYHLKHPDVWRGKNHNGWRGGRHKNRDGYVYVYKPNHPNARNGRYVFEHRIVMEKHLGRYLKSNEIVHHKDGNKTNNNISNLYLTTKEKHKLSYGDAYQDGYKNGFAVALFFCLMSNKYREN